METILQDLKMFMYLKSNYPEYKEPQIKIEKKVIEYKIKNKEYNYSLFWCLYLMNNKSIPKNQVVVEIQEKYKIVEYCHLNKDKLTNPIWGGKITKTEMDKIVLESRYSIKLFIILCHLYNLSFTILFQNNLYFEHNVPNTEHYILKYDQLNKKDEIIYVDYFNNQDKSAFLDSIYKRWDKLETLSYKIKAVSGYKKEDLVEICGKIGLETDKKNKPELYELIQKYYSDRTII
jgi:hypothetical protein